jgi:hypothetical protein
VNPSARALDECPTYRVDEKVRVVGAYEWSGEDEAARMRHADPVVADALVLDGLRDGAAGPAPPAADRAGHAGVHAPAEGRAGAAEGPVVRRTEGRGPRVPGLTLA